MPGSLYPVKDLVEFDLGSVDAPDLWIKMASPDTISAGDVLRLQKAQLIMMRLGKGNKVPKEEDDWVVTCLHDLLPKVIKEWNLPYPGGHEKEGEVIPLNGVSSFDPIPGFVYAQIIKEVTNRLMAEPKRSSK